MMTTEYCRKCSHEACKKCGLNTLELETFDTIHQWALDTFGPAEPLRTIDRANEEFDEVFLAATPEELIEEAADVIITLCNLPGIAEAINKKMAKNRARKWHVMGDGTGYHVQEAPQS